MLWDFVIYDNFIKQLIYFFALNSNLINSSIIIYKITRHLSPFTYATQFKKIINKFYSGAKKYNYTSQI